MQTSTHSFPWGEADRRRLVRLCASLSGDAGAAEDLAQETLLEAWRHAHKLTDRAGADRWLAAVARNVCLRGGRRAGRQADVESALRAAAVEAGDADARRAELDGALRLLPEEARTLLVRRHVDERSPRELAAELGISVDAVSMRLARARAELRRALTTDTWRPTRVWCAQCGRRRLLTRSGAAISFRCPGCSPDADTASSEYRLDNPTFGALLGAVTRPTSVLDRASRWSEGYFAAGAGHDVSCTRCTRPVRLRRYERADAPQAGPHRHGLHATCGACGETVSSSLGGLALVQPAARAFRREHPRTEARAIRTVDFGGTPALVAEYGSVLGSATVAAVFRRDTLDLLAVG